MGFSPGKNNGVTGLVDFDGSAPFTIEALEWESALNAPTKPRNGPGADGYKSRTLDESGSVTVWGKVNGMGCPLPSAIRYATGTLTIQANDSQKTPYNVTCTTFRRRKSQAKEDAWNVTIGFNINTRPSDTWTGKAQTTVNPPAENNQEVWGRAKSQDGNGLVGSSTRIIDIEGMGDLDTDDVTKLQALIAAAATPVTGQKFQTARIERDSKGGGVCVLSFGLTDAKDDIQNPNTRDTNDPNDLQDAAVRAIVHDTASPPSDPTVSGLKLVTKTTTKLNDVKSVTIYSFGLRDTVDEIQNPNTKTSTDGYYITDTAVRAVVHDTTSTPSTPSSPTSQKLLRTEIVKLNDNKSATFFYYGTKDVSDELILPSTTAESSLMSSDRWSSATLVNSSSSPRTYLESVITSFAAEDYAYEIIATKPTPDTILVRKMYMDYGYIQGGYSGGTMRWVHARLSSGSIQVYVADVLNRGGGKYAARIIPAKVSSIYRRFFVQRVVMSTTVPDQSSLLGNVNASTFKGLAAGTVRYIGAQFRARLDTGASTIPYFMEYFFENDSNGFIEYSDIINAYRHLTASVSANSWVGTSSFTPAISASQPTSGDFSVFDM